MQNAFVLVVTCLACGVLMAGCGVGAGIGAALLAPVWVPYCLLYDCDLYGKGFGPDVLTGDVRIQNDSPWVFVGMSAHPPGDGPPYEFGSAEEPLLPGGYVDVSLPVGPWPLVELHAEDGSVRRFFDIVVDGEWPITLRLE